MAPLAAALSACGAGVTAVEALSFYRFMPVADPGALAATLSRVWGVYGATGRVYVASEGVNAQMAVPVQTVAARAYYAVPAELRGVFVNRDRVVSLADEVPFEALHVRARHQVLADGFSYGPAAVSTPLPEGEGLNLDWSASGEEVSPAQWHAELSAAGPAVAVGGSANVAADDPEAGAAAAAAAAAGDAALPPIVLDCRNGYESDVGRFDGAVPLDTAAFPDTWAALAARLDGVDRRRRVLTYCTGGIRCVKVGAYLGQVMGFENCEDCAVSFAGACSVACRDAGALLAMLVSLTAAKRVLEVGTFTGYGAVAMAAAVPSGGVVVTLERDEAVAATAAEAFATRAAGRIGGSGGSGGAPIDLRVGPALDAMDTMTAAAEAPFDLVYIDADKKAYPDYYERCIGGGLLRVGGLMAGEVARLRRQRARSLVAANRTAAAIHAFNELVAADPRTEQVLLPMRDGLTLIRRVA
ncbi:hypothetical protein I4F81_007264 [Pyropia yezoensis]|uniref:Uncharacterized protein n=1 Tax=Pyropia yezoensis TaxID=2788 RepID=A0ACC3C3E6_PYRYE|nr:hypothetical protein I4F81_007264 [Neopyropia yezoensis]